MIDRYLLGWNGVRITIPVKNRDGAIFSFRLARDPEDSVSPKMISTSGSQVALFGQADWASFPGVVVARRAVDLLGFHLQLS